MMGRQPAPAPERCSTGWGVSLGPLVSAPEGRLTLLTYIFPKEGPGRQKNSSGLQGFPFPKAN